jgi:hypothetical protein
MDKGAHPLPRDHSVVRCLAGSAAIVTAHHAMSADGSKLRSSGETPGARPAAPHAPGQQCAAKHRAVRLAPACPIWSAKGGRSARPACACRPLAQTNRYRCQFQAKPRRKSMVWLHRWAVGSVSFAITRSLIKTVIAALGEWSGSITISSCFAGVPGLLGMRRRACPSVHADPISHDSAVAIPCGCRWHKSDNERVTLPAAQARGNAHPEGGGIGEIILSI